ATLSWSADAADQLAIDNGIGLVNGSSAVVSPAASTTYTLTAKGPGGQVTAKATVTVTAPVSPPTISAFSATPATITRGGSSTLAWTVSGATSLSIAPSVGAVTGAQTSVAPTITTTYTL